MTHGMIVVLRGIYTGAAIVLGVSLWHLGVVPTQAVLGQFVLVVVIGAVNGPRRTARWLRHGTWMGQDDNQ